MFASTTSSSVPIVIGDVMMSSSGGSTAAASAPPLMGAAALAAGIAAGNINSAPPLERMALSESSRASADANTHLLLRLEAQRRMRTVGAPAADADVRIALRSRHQPITLFAEGPPERRARLQLLMAEADVEASVAEKGVAFVVAMATAAAGGDGAAIAAVARLASVTGVGGVVSSAALAAGGVAPKPELFYTPASDELVEARRMIAIDSFLRASARLEKEKETTDTSVTSTRHHRNATSVRSQASLVADDRPLSTISVASDGSIVAVGSWSPVIKLLDTGSARIIGTLRGHTDRVCSVSWAPGTGVGRLHKLHDAVCSSLPINDLPPIGLTDALLASASSDGTARVWKLPIDTIRNHDVSATGSGGGGGGLNFTPTATLTGHVGRLACIAWHPTSRFIGTTGYDRSWRLWDVERSQELLLQEGHSKEAYAIAFHPDGSLVATGDFSGLGRVWDLRSGKSIFLLRGHAKSLLSLDWSPNGRSIASASEDGTSCIWDVRQQRLIYAIPAHTGIVSKVRFEQNFGNILATASFDGTSKLWNAIDFSPLKTLPGEARVTGMDIFHAQNGKRLTIVTASFDRNVKLWAGDDEKD